MNKLLLIVLLLLPSLSHADIFAFVGSPLSVELLDRSCADFIEQSEDSEFETICMTRVFNLKYSVSEVLYGSLSDQSIEFIGFYHSWGMPVYTTFEPALIILETYKEDFLLLRIDNLVTKNDQWWVCEEIPEDEFTDCTIGRFASEIIAQEINGP